jgi:hypothetical protein
MSTPTPKSTAAAAASAVKSVAIYYNKTCFGLERDAGIIEKLVRSMGGVTSVHRLDMNEPAVAADCAFHLETPVYQAMGYSHTNVLMVNAEQWISSTYDPYLATFDRIFVRCADDRDRFQRDLRALGRRWEHVVSIPWSLGGADTHAQEKPVVGGAVDDKIGFVCFIGKNQYKYEWLRDFLAGGGWQQSFPALRIYTADPKFADGLRVGAAGAAEAPNIQVDCRDLDAAQIDRLQWLHAGHLLCSRGEGFGYAAAEAEAHGARLLLSDLPVFREYYGAHDGAQETVAWLPSRRMDTSDASVPKARQGLRYELAAPDLSDGGLIENAVKSLAGTVTERLERGRAAAQRRWETTQNTFRTELWTPIESLVQERRPKSGNWHVPPAVVQSDCPPITIVTPTRNRRALIDIAFHNLLSTDYPLEKITWIVVENSDNNDKAASDKIMNFQINCKAIRVKYIPLPGVGRKSVGELRNIGVEHAEDDLVVFMDDDDHYPVTSLRRRVSWLLRGLDGNIAGRRARIVGCTTLALYDLRRGVSAVNVPPWDLPLAQRISEATLAFHKSAWLDRKFGDVGVAEGESWIQGREEEFLEIPPQQIIVAFSHGENSTSRRVPVLEEPNGCFWGFPREYLTFVHGLVGVGVEEERAAAGARTGGVRERLQARLAERRTQ